MRSFIAACLFAFAAAQDGNEVALKSCAQLTDDVATRAISNLFLEFSAIRVYGSESWTIEQKAEFDAKTALIQADSSTDEARAAYQVISNYTWVDKDVSDNTPIESIAEFVDLEAKVLTFGAPGWPVEEDYEAACFAADEEETTDEQTIDEILAAIVAEAEAQALAVNEMTWDKLENPHDVTTDDLLLKNEDNEDEYVSMKAKTGWQPALNNDESVIFNFMFSIDTWNAYTNAGISSLTIAFADAEDSTDIEVNRFQFVDLVLNEYARLIYDKMNMEADDDELTTDTTLSSMTGFAPFDDEKSFELQWIGSNIDNYGPSQEPRATFAKDKETPGFWSIVESATSLTSTGFVCSLEKSADSLGMTKAIKAGGSIMMKVGYKEAIVTDFTAHSDLIEVAWAAEPVVEDPEDPNAGGNVDDGGDGGNTDNNDGEDGATAVTAFGAAVIAAISALAF